MNCFGLISLLLIIYASCNSAARSKSSRAPVTPIKMYFVPPSPPCRAVMMTAKVIGVELDLVFTNIMEGEQLKPEFLKMNPTHTVPTIDDNGFILWESRAIMAYLVGSYARDDTLYPKNLRLRAIVDQYLQFDLGVLFARYLALYRPMFFGQPFDEENAEKLREALGWLNTMLEGKAFLAGENLTIADITVVVTITNLSMFEFDLQPYENINKWFDRTKLSLKPYGYDDIDVVGAEILSSFLKKD